MKRLYIHHTSAFLAAPDTALGAYKQIVKQLSGHVLRRANRFVLLSVIGALQCTRDAALDPLTGIYLATENGNLSDTENVLDQIFHQGNLPMPYNFIHTMSNTAAFYVANQLGLSGPNMTISSKYLSYERALELARLDLSSGRVHAALIGGVDDAGLPALQFGQRYPQHAAVKLTEGSCWQYVNGQPVGALGYIDGPVAFAAPDALITYLRQMAVPGAPWQVCWGLNVDPAVKQACNQALPDLKSLDFIHDHGYFDTLPAGVVSRFLEPRQPGNLAWVNTDKQERWMMISISRSI